MTFALLTNPNLRPDLSSPRSIERSALATSFARRARDLGHVVGLGGDKLKNFDRSHWFHQDENGTMLPAAWVGVVGTTREAALGAALGSVPDTVVARNKISSRNRGVKDEGLYGKRVAGAALAGSCST